MRIHTTSRFNFDSASRQLDTRDLHQILDEDTDMGAAWAAAVQPFTDASIEAAILAGDILSPETAADEYVAKGDLVFNVKDYGALGNNVADDTAAIQDAITAAQAGAASGAAYGITGATVYFPPGEYRITDQITLENFNGVLYGAGTGNSPHYSLAPGNASVIRWDGDNATPMIHLHDCRGVTIQRLRLEGNDTNPPTHGIECVQLPGDSAGTNAEMHFLDLYIGSYTWSSQGLDSGDVTTGVGFTGTNVNNDQWTIQRCAIKALSYGVHIPNTQSIWNAIRDTVIGSCGLAGIKVHASLHVYNLQCDDNALDFDILESANVCCYGYSTERATKLVNINTTGGSFSCFGGRWHLAECTVGAPFFNAEGMYSGTQVNLIGVKGSDIPSGATIKAVGGGGAGTSTQSAFTHIGSNFALSSYDLSCGPSDSMRVLLMGHPGFVSCRLYNETMSTTAAFQEIGGTLGAAIGPRMFSGTGSPEGVITARIGSQYARTDGGAGTSFYVKESGTGNTGWVAK